MTSDSRPDVTQLLLAWTKGDQAALKKLTPIVFAELKRLARWHLSHERPDHTLESGALVNEAYLRLVDWKSAHWQNRAHFFGMCSRIMRQILVDHARGRNYQKRDVRRTVPFEDAVVLSSLKGEEILALDDALTRLENIHPRKAAVVEMRFFGGLTAEETAEEPE